MANYSPVPQDLSPERSEEPASFIARWRPVFMVLTVLNCLIIFGVFGFPAYVSYIAEPLPRFQIEQVSVSLHNISYSSQRSAKWNIGVSITNPSTISNVTFNEINMSIRYNDGESTGVFIPPFRLDREDTTKRTNTTLLTLWHEENYLSPVEMLNFEATIQMDLQYDDWIPSPFKNSGRNQTLLCKDIQIGFSSNVEKGNMVGEPISCLTEWELLYPEDKR